MIKEIILKGRQRSMMFVLLLVMAVATFAVPAKPGLTRTLILADGTTVNAVLVGDEHGHFWRGADGKSYQAVAGTDYYQAVNSQDIIKKAQRRRAQANQRRTKRLAPRKEEGESGIIGKKKGLIILVNFSDVAFQEGNTNALFQRIANEENFSYDIPNSSYSFKGSMHDYFYAQSEGLFELTFDVVGPVTVSNEQAYYGENDDNGDDKHPAEMVIEALKLADEDVNYANYDWDGNGEVEQVYVLYAGNGEADSGVEDAIWPHEWMLDETNYNGDGSGSLTLDGVKIDTYACGEELNGDGFIAGIATICHEFSHCLGYPDFYDIDYSGGQGMGDWDLMDRGSYNGGGYQPAGYTSYERWVAGWKTPITLETTQDIQNMAALQTKGSNTYIIYNKGNNNEYFLLENRQKTGWDASLPGAGLLILHVDYNATVWEQNQPNDDPSHQCMTWIPADNQYQYETYNGLKYYTTEGFRNDPFPYGNVNAFGKNTSPAATLYNPNEDGTYYLDCSILNITQNNDGTVSFLFNGESNMVPTAPLELANNSDNSSAIATAVTNGGYYDVTLNNRTLWKDGAWNTLCLPFNVALEGSPLADATLMELDVTGKYDTDKQTGLDADGTLYLYFKEATSIAAGKPYIIKWASGSIIENPMFTGVTFSCDTTVCIESTDGNVTFRGTYNAQTFTTDNRNILFLGGENRLYDPLNGAGIGACHAYFQLNNGLTAGDLPANGIKMFFSNGETGIASPKSSPEGQDFSRLLQKGTKEAWYTLDGRSLSGKPAKKGIYIHGNTKVAIK